MINSETFIVKRDGKKEAFSLDKNQKMQSVRHFLSVGSFATPGLSLPIFSAA